MMLYLCRNAFPVLGKTLIIRKKITSLNFRLRDCEILNQSSLKKKTTMTLIIQIKVKEERELILKSLKITNVTCYDQGEIEFVPGRNVIIGNNSSGKSTILQSFLNSLISQYPEGTNDQLVRSGEDTARFKLKFEQNGNEYVVERKLRRYSSPEAFLTDLTGNDLLARFPIMMTRHRYMYMEITSHTTYLRSDLTYHNSSLFHILMTKSSSR